jgi:hypothetical protein
MDRPISIVCVNVRMFGYLLVICHLASHQPVVRLLNILSRVCPRSVGFEYGDQALATFQTTGASRTVLTMSTPVSQLKRTRMPHLE